MNINFYFSWEPEGCYQHLKMFHWEPEGWYHCPKSMVIITTLQLHLEAIHWYPTIALEGWQCCFIFCTYTGITDHQCTTHEIVRIPRKCKYAKVIGYQCCVRVQVVKSESRLSNPSPSPSHHLWVRVRVITSKSKSESESSPQSLSQKNFSSPSHESSYCSPHIQHLFVFQNMKTNHKMYRMSE